MDLMHHYDKTKNVLNLVNYKNNKLIIQENNYKSKFQNSSKGDTYITYNVTL